MSTTLHIALWLACTAVAAVIVFKVLVSTEKKARHTGAQDARTTPNRNLRELLAHGATLQMAENGFQIVVINKHSLVLARADNAIIATDTALNKLRAGHTPLFGTSSEAFAAACKTVNAMRPSAAELHAAIAAAGRLNPAPKARP